ncbi:MAG: ISL3 family transposase [Deltaproteobacteria bacterium]|nr:ISL3 family transposase [Deltaproteobacteria bacterium]
MQKRSIWLKLLGVQGAVLERVEFDGEMMRFHVRHRAGTERHCPECDRICGGYDHSDKPHTWRALDLGLARAVVSAHLHRVNCPEHGVVLESVPWARRGSAFTRQFEDTVTWLAVRMNKSAVAEFMRLAWRTVGSILERVCEEGRAVLDFPEVKRIGIDEVSYRKGHRYLTVVVDHDSNRLLFAHRGKSAGALKAFFKGLGKEGCAAIELVSADGAKHWHDAVRKHCPNARICMDPFHVVKWATEALDEIRRQVWRAARQGDDEHAAASVKHMRWALLKNPENLTTKQRTTLKEIEAVNKPLFRAYLLKEQLRDVFKTGGQRGIALLDTWIAWAETSGLNEFIGVAQSISDVRQAVDDALTSGLSNGRVESMNTRMQLLTRTAFGFHSAEALIALAYAKFGGLCPPLPTRLS